MRNTRALLVVLLLVLFLVLVLTGGCEVVDEITGVIDEAIPTPSTSPPASGRSPETPASPSAAAEAPASTEESETKDDGLKTILVYPQPGVENATVNGVSVITGQDNEVQIDPNQPLQIMYTFTNSRGNRSEAVQDLDTHYDFHVLKANGGWASTVHRNAHEAYKNNP